MKRRTMLKGVAAALATAPAWVQRAFAADECSPATGTKAPGNASAALAGAYRSAQRGGRPLLVLVIPENKELRWARGAAFGEWLNHGSAEQLRPLAQLEVVCARMSVLRRLVPSVPRGEPVMVLVDTDQSPAVVRFLERELPPRQFRLEEDEANAQIDARIGLLSELLREATVSDTAATARRLAQHNLTLTPADHARLSGDVASLDLAFVERAAPALAAVAEGSSARAAQARARLDALIASKVKKPPRGARWANSHGCGTDIEGEVSNVMMACGMGSTPERSRRFLYFFAGPAHADDPPDEE